MQALGFIQYYSMLHDNFCEVNDMASNKESENSLCRSKPLLSAK